MRSLKLVAFAAALAAAPLLAVPGEAGVLEGLHGKVRVGNRLCFADHAHSGTSFGGASKGHALQLAIRDWSGFTALEYGDEWGHFSLAWAKSIRCEPSATGHWSCQIEARPCRAG